MLIYNFPIIVLFGKVRNIMYICDLRGFVFLISHSMLNGLAILRCLPAKNIVVAIFEDSRCDYGKAGTHTTHKYATLTYGRFHGLSYPPPPTMGALFGR